MAKKYFKLGTVIFLAGVILWIYRAHNFSKYTNIDEMRVLIDSFGPYGPLVFIGLCIAGVFLHLPEIILIAIGGLLFGVVKGFIYGWIGVIVGSAGTFLCVRYIMRDAFQKSVENRFYRLQTFDARLAEHGFLTVLLLRLALFMAPPLNWAIGLTRVRFCQYIAGSAVGVVPCIAIACYFADSIASLKTTEPMFTLKMVVPAGMVAALLIISGILARRLFGKQPIPTSQDTQ
ncbi:MAG: VTT domain-containing protein [Syntrophus sp. (in: bacteria)]